MSRLQRACQTRECLIEIASSPAKHYSISNFVNGFFHSKKSLFVSFDLAMQWHTVVSRLVPMERKVGCLRVNSSLCSQLPQRTRYGVALVKSSL
jgi:hypothetical protein